MSMRILFWTESFWPSIGGVETFSRQVLPRMRSRGITFCVVTGAGAAPAGTSYAVDGIPVRAWPFYETLARRDPSRLAALRGEIRELKNEFQPDLVHLNTLTYSAVFHLETRDACPAPVLVTIHSALEQQDTGPDSIGGRVLRSADRINACSNAVLAEARRRLPDRAPRMTSIPYGAEIPGAAVRPRQLEEPVILCYGRMVRPKGFDLALQAFAAIVRTWPQARLCLAGDGPERPRLEELAARLGVEDRVDFAGWVKPDDVPELLNRATLVVVPSRWEEPFGLVALEAGAMARPVIAARAGGLAEAVEHQRTGWLVTRESVAEFATAIDRLLREPELAEALGQAARRRVADRFSWDRCARSYEDLYRELLQGACP
jgi:glycogen(starch) synthase